MKIIDIKINFGYYPAMMQEDLIETPDFEDKKPQTVIRALFHDNAADITQCHHVAVDVQRGFCNAAEAAYITDNMAPQLKALGVDTDWVYLTPTYKGRPGPEKACGGTYKAASALDAGDRLVAKFNASAFVETRYDQILKQDNKKILIVSGYSYGCCVSATALDARKNGYQVIVLKDATDYNGSWEYIGKELTAAGVILADSTDVIDCLKAVNPAVIPTP